MSRLFEAITIRGMEFKNRIFVSPMCQYSSVDGLPNDWHMVHLGSRAVGGAALVICEATAVSAEGRISPGDAGIWSERHVEALRPIVRFIQSQGAKAGIQIAHAGRKASTHVPWDTSGGAENRQSLSASEGAWATYAPSAVPFDVGWQTPVAMTDADIAKVTNDTVDAVNRANQAGYDVVELHFAHGYLFAEFLSPLSNKRTDRYGGSLENRMRFPLEVARAVRAQWTKPLFVRISATEWVEGGWDLEQSVQFAKELKTIGVDLVDCSTGGNIPKAKIPVGPGYQVQFAEGVKIGAGIATGAVGMITEPQQAEDIIARGQADVVLLARELLRDPYWPLHAAHVLGVNVSWVKQYDRAKPR